MFLLDYETISNKVSFEEESPEWASMDISLRVDPTGQTDPVILTKGERSSRSGSSNAGSGKKNSALFHSFYLSVCIF